jgi:hypothetical protein
MNNLLYNEFLESGDSLRVYVEDMLVFSSRKEGLMPLLEYIDRLAIDHLGVTILDKIMGNAAALLSIKAGCQEAGSPLGSQLAIATLEKYGIKYRLNRIIPYIKQPYSADMCPMEKLSIDKDPEGFYALMKTKII